MSTNETILAAAITRLNSLGEIKTRINPDLKGGEKSIEVFVELGKERVQAGVEITVFPIEKITFWMDGVEKEEGFWAYLLDGIENDLSD